MEANRLADLFRSFPRIYDRHRVLALADEGKDLDEARCDDLKLRQDALGYDALAWACFKKGDQAEAELARLLKAVSSGTQSATIYSHAGRIASASGDRERAESFRARLRLKSPPSPGLTPPGPGTRAMFREEAGRAGAGLLALFGRNRYVPLYVG